MHFTFIGEAFGSPLIDELILLEIFVTANNGLWKTISLIISNCTREQISLSANANIQNKLTKYFFDGNKSQTQIN